MDRPTPRRRKLIKPSLQLRLVGAFLGISALVLMAQVLLFGLRLTEFADGMPTGGRELNAFVPELLTSVLLESALVLVPITIGFGILATFRTAGPIYRFERYLEQVANGERVGPCRIREHDHLQELCERINEALAYARSHPDAPEADDAGTSEPRSSSEAA